MAKGNVPAWKRKAAARKAGARRRLMRRRVNKNNVREWASLTESIAPGTLASNTPYSSYNLSLAQLPRAINVAKSYQFYRIKRVTYVVKPNVDTFSAGGANSLPYLYYMIDRTQQFQNYLSPTMLRAAGAKPRRVDEKSITFSYTPSVLNLTFDNTANSASNVSYRMCPWLPCRDITNVDPTIWNPNTTDHQGIVFYIETQGQPLGFTFERRYEIEFKKPIVQKGLNDEGGHAPETIDPDIVQL